MAGFSSGDDDDIIAGINVTPLVDIVLVLLIIFMVTTSYIVKAQIEIDLPKAASGQSEVKETFALQVDAEGKFYVNGEERTIQQIGDWAKAEKKRNPSASPVCPHSATLRRTVDIGDRVDLFPSGPRPLRSGVNETGQGVRTPNGRPLGGVGDPRVQRSAASHRTGHPVDTNR